jgi:hypothetical protein
MSDLNKTIIYPKVVVYHNLLKDPDKVTNMLVEHKGATETDTHLTPWRDWKPMGNIMNIDGAPGDYTEKEDARKIFQETNLKNIYDAFYKASDDFFEEYKFSGGWPKYLKTWERDKAPWSHSAISFLRYDPTNYNYDFKNNKAGLAMDYHTDSAAFNEIDPGRKFVVTVTMYMNEDYDGGEISFLDESTSKLTNYKPKAGDVTVFPSGHPYFHGVLPISGGDRYILRMFWFCEYEGDPEWHEGKLKYGEEQWNIMHKQYMDKEFNSGKYHRVVVLPGEEFDEVNQRSIPFYLKEEDL